MNTAWILNEKEAVSALSIERSNQRNHLIAGYRHQAQHVFSRPSVPSVEPSADRKLIDPVMVPVQEDMPPPIPARYLKKKPVADKDQKITHNQNRQGLLPAQDQKQIGGKESVETKLICLDNLESPTLNFYNYDSADFDILDKLKPIIPGAHVMLGSIIYLVKPVLIRRVFSIKTKFFLFNGMSSKEECDLGYPIEDALDDGYSLTRTRSSRQAVFTAGNSDCKYDRFLWERRDEEVQLKTQHLESKALDDPEKLKIIIQDTVEKILVNRKILPPKTSIGLLAALKDKLIEAIQQAASNTSDLNKRARLEKHCETLMCGKGCDVQLTYDQFNAQIELLRVMLESAKDVARDHSNLALRALSHFSLAPGTSSFIASESLFGESEDILSRLSASFENNGDSKSMSSGR